ncbi:MAG: hypothetical protein ACRD21_18235 [Vicinamibacteria bacterium]
MPESKGIPAWAWVGCGCVGALGAVPLLVVAVGVWGVQKASQLAEDMADPDERAENALEVLGANEIPQGYYPLVAFSVPFLFMKPLYPCP